ncbi:hypothetical protein BC831DRAFT_466674 [Entophlyctis helioformis]|nr:hypothetical protein BC831DRAFT_466674 [Entophlyctis helioformis]
MPARQLAELASSLRTVSSSHISRAAPHAAARVAAQTAGPSDTAVQSAEQPVDLTQTHHIPGKYLYLLRQPKQTKETKIIQQLERQDRLHKKQLQHGTDAQQLLQHQRTVHKAAVLKVVDPPALGIVSTRQQQQQQHQQQPSTGDHKGLQREPSGGPLGGTSTNEKQGLEQLPRAHGKRLHLVESLLEEIRSSRQFRSLLYSDHWRVSRISMAPNEKTCSVWWAFEGLADPDRVPVSQESLEQTLLKHQPIVHKTMLWMIQGWHGQSTAQGARRIPAIVFRYDRAVVQQQKLDEALDRIQLEQTLPQTRQQARQQQ